MTTKKIVAVVVGLATASMMFAAVAVPAPAQAQTSAELQTQIQALLAQIAALQAQMGGSVSTPAASMMFTSNLTIGSSGAEVTALQNFLIGQGNAIPAGATGYFGAQTKAALAAYQAANGIAPAVGYFGPISRAKVNASGTIPAVPGTPGTPATPAVPGNLDGGAGSIEDADFVSNLSSEEVGEDAEDVEVAGLEIDADSGSDIEITAVRLDFDQGTAGSDFDNYATEVSIWFEGEEVARVDADEFNDDNNFDSTISLDRGAIIRAGDTNAELVVAVSGVNNLDSADSADTWTVIFENVRFRDAQGAVITDSSTGDIGTETRTFSFESFSTAADVELKIQADDDSVNDPHVIEVHATNKTPNVELMSFTLEAEGDSDLEIKRFGVNVDTTATHVDGIIAGSSSPAIMLVIDGEEYGTASYFDDANGLEVGQDEDVVWDDVNFTIPAGDTVEVVIMADILNLTGQDVDAGDTITVTLGETETDQIGSASLVEVEDESGEDIVDADITGSLTAGAHEVQVAGIMVALVGTPTAVDDNASLDLATGDDTGIYQIVFDVTAFGSAVYVDGDVVATATPTVGTDGISWASTTNSTGGASTSVLAVMDGSGSETNDVTTAGSLSFEVPEDETRRFTLDVQISSGGTNSVDLVQGVRLTGIKWDSDSGDDHANVYTLDLGAYKTGVLNLEFN